MQQTLFSSLDQDVHHDVYVNKLILYNLATYFGCQLIGRKWSLPSAEIRWLLRI
jgi:hypothetical protein